ncbi:MAG: hypothetical protein DLM59_17930 [Pseudonocardiales bacterium]|nr:MAG: hypothetical protein DLM59_17930 [Pseudonocardiales bacterium]
MVGYHAEEIRPGDIYEDCAFHPVLCTHVGDDEIQGISLIDATGPRSCSTKHCGVFKLSIADVRAARADWPVYLAQRKSAWNRLDDDSPADAQ